MIESGLTRTDRWVQGIAIISGVVGVLLLLGFTVYLWFGGYRPSTEFDAAKTGQVGDFIGGVSGSLFALAAGLLFYLTLTLQRREFKNSLEELRLSREALDRAAKHHEDTLSVMREEKDFNICHTAAQSLLSELSNIHFTEYPNPGILVRQEYRGDAAINAMTRKWKNDMRDRIKVYEGDDYSLAHTLPKLDWSFHRFQELYDLNLRLFMVTGAIGKKTSLGRWEQDYLKALTWPALKSIPEAQDSNIRGTVDHIDQLVKLDDVTLAKQKTNVAELNSWRQSLTKLMDLRSQEILV